MRILLASDWFLKLVVEGQAKALRALGHDVLLLCRDHTGEFMGHAEERQTLLENLRNSGVEILILGGPRFGATSLPRALSAMRRVKAWRPEVASVHENADPRLRIASLGLPTLYTVHDPTPHPGAKPANTLERVGSGLWMRSANEFVVHGRALIPELRRQAHGRQINVIPHGVDVQAEPLRPPEDPALLLFGRLEPYKGIKVLAEAMPHIWARRPDIKLIIAGRGPAAADAPRDPRVEMRSEYVQEHELDQLLKRASVAVLPYTQASQSGVGLLMLAHGIPTVVTDVGALSELALDGRHLAPPRDPVALATRVLEIVETNLPGRKRVLEFARERFSWNAIAERYVEVYERLLRD